MKPLPFDCSLACEIGVCCLLLVLLQPFTFAQSAGNHCAPPPPPVKEGLKQIDNLFYEDPSNSALARRRLALAQELAKRFPDDMVAQRRYQDEWRHPNADLEVLLAEYRARLDKQPNDPAAIYLNARLLIGTQTKEVIETLNKLKQQAPDFIWTYRELIQIYNYPNFRDPVQARANLKEWMTRCPAALEAYQHLARLGDQEMLKEGATRLRAWLTASSEPDELRHYSTLWAFEFKLKPLSEHASVRQQVAEDVKRLREKNLEPGREWLTTLRDGYKMVEDKEGASWAEEKLRSLAPARPAVKRETFMETRVRWDKEHPWQPGAPPEQIEAYQRARYQATAEWVSKWPDEVEAWGLRLFAARELPELSNAEIEAIIANLTKAIESNGSVRDYGLPIAYTYLKRNIQLEHIPALVQQGIAHVEKQLKRQRPSDLMPTDERFASGASAYNFAHWAGWPLLVEAYAKLKQPDKARQHLAQMAEALKTTKPAEKANDMQKRSYLANQVIYWQTVAKLSESENRKLDALNCYQTALSLRPKIEGPFRDELTENTQRLWKELGGTAEGWQAFLSRNEETKSKLTVSPVTFSTWLTKNQPLSDFALNDLQGKSWRLAELKGKVTFINFWATWCGPCKVELPLVQKLHEQMKERKDTQVLTINMDEGLGLVEPFLKENKYTFTVIPAVEYAARENVSGIPRNWIINPEGTIVFDGIGFGGSGEEWIKKVTEMLEKARGGK
jgi:thiol-disulfide isomerase/thioredoxin